MISIEDMSNEEIEDVLELAREMAGDLRGYSTLAQGYIMASLFFEPQGSEFECSRTVHPGGGFTLRCEPP